MMSMRVRGLGAADDSKYCAGTCAVSGGIATITKILKPRLGRRLRTRRVPAVRPRVTGSTHGHGKGGQGRHEVLLPTCRSQYKVLDYQPGLFLLPRVGRKI